MCDKFNWLFYWLAVWLWPAAQWPLVCKLMTYQQKVFIKPNSALQSMWSNSLKTLCWPFSLLYKIFNKTTPICLAPPIVATVWVRATSCPSIYGPIRKWPRQVAPLAVTSLPGLTVIRLTHRAISSFQLLAAIRLRANPWPKSIVSYAVNCPVI